MARFIIPVEELPPPNVDGNHVFRFRIISEDQNTASQYSTLYSVESKGLIYPEQYDPQISSSGSVINITWETPSFFNISSSAMGVPVLHNHLSEWKSHPMDVFVSWDSGDYEYYARTVDSNIEIIKRSGSSSLQVFVQMANYPPTKSEKFKILDTGTISV